MTGHHIYTRSWFEYGSRTKNPGTFTVELTDNIFGANTKDVIYNRLNSVYSKTQPSIAGKTHDESLLRIFHPTTDSTVVSRSYFVNDEITERGTVQYSFGLVFTDEQNKQFLDCPEHAFLKSSIETYDEFKSRVTQDGTLVYSGAYDPKKEEYEIPLFAGKSVWEEYGFGRNEFVGFFVSLCKAITSAKGNAKVALVLPDGADSEKMILAVLSILPKWLKHKFGAASRWVGLPDGAATGMQLLCYVGEKPPFDFEAPVIDLTGAGSAKNLEPVTEEQREIAAWYWDNLDNPEVIGKMTHYMSTRYNTLTEKMPFEILAHCFWLWRTFSEEYQSENISFAVAARAIRSLAAAFGRRINEFFKDAVTFNNIVKIYATEVQNVSTAEMSGETMRAICIFASGDVENKLGSMLFRDFVKPLFNKLFSAGEYGKLEPIMQYYAAILSTREPENKVDEAYAAMVTALGAKDDNFAKASGKILQKYANDLATAFLTMSGDKSGQIEAYFNRFIEITGILKNAGVHMALELTIQQGVPVNADMYIELELYLRGSNSNEIPPDNKQLEKVVGMLDRLPPHSRAVKSEKLFLLYWQASELNESEKKRRYVEYLRTNGKLPYFLAAGNDEIEEFIREIYYEKISEICNARAASAQERVAGLLGLYKEIEECGFKSSDTVYERYNRKLKETIGDFRVFCAAASPRTLEELEEMLRGSGEKLESLLKLVIIFDRNIAGGGLFSDRFEIWKEEPGLIKTRMLYWYSAKQDPPNEWALSLSVIDLLLNPNSEFDIAAFIKYKREKRSSGDAGIDRDVADLFELLPMVCEHGRYGNYAEIIYRSFLERIVKLAENSPDTFVKKSKDFENALRLSAYDDHISYLGRIIRDRLTRAYSGDDAVNEEILDRYSKLARQAGASQNYGAYTNKTQILIAAVTLCIMLFAACGAAFMSEIRQMMLSLPAWVLITLSLIVIITSVIATAKKLIGK